MVALGCLEEAESLIGALERNGSQLDRAWMLAVGARCRSMWLAARGDVAGAERVALQAMNEHERLPMPFERARTLLIYGTILRRSKRRKAAREAIGQSLAQA